MKELLLDGFLDALIDSLKILPFLFIAYLIMEYVEHSMEEKTKDIVRKSGKMGPLFGGICGAVPQCGFSAAASNLYAGRVITIGTLIAVYLSTSDEMLPIFISEHVPILSILKILLIKIVIGVIWGFIIDFFLAKNMHIRAYAERVPEEDAFHIDQMCESEQCKCDDGILKSAVKHTLHIIIFLILISFVLNVCILNIGEENIGSFVLNKPFLGVVFAAVVGLIPNCVASVVITNMYLNGLMSFGAMMGGLLVGAGVGLLVLCRANRPVKDTVKVIAILFGCGLVSGMILDLLHIAL